MKQLTACVLLLIIVFACQKRDSSANLNVQVRDSTIILSNGRYNSFGNLIPISSNEIMLYYRSGTSHTANGRIECTKYNVNTNTWRQPIILFSPVPGADYRDPNAGILNNEKIILFTTRYITAKDSVQDLGYFLSTDMTGTNFSSYRILMPPSGITRAITYGPMIESDEPNTYYAVAYGYVGTTYKVWIWKITYNDGDVNISRIDVYSGTIQITETSIARLGNGRFILVSRINNRNQMVQFTSSDGGYTWSNPQNTNMGTSNSVHPCVPYTKLMNGHLYCIYQNRQTGYICVSKSNPDIVFSSPTSWSPVNYYFNIGKGNGAYLGYPSGCIIPGRSNWMMLVWCYEKSNTAAEYRFKLDDFSQLK